MPPDVGGEQGVELRRHLGRHAEPLPEARYCLVQQHAQSLGRAMAAAGGLGQKRCLQRHIDDVGDDGCGLQGVERQFEGAARPLSEGAAVVLGADYPLSLLLSGLGHVAVGAAE